MPLRAGLALPISGSGSPGRAECDVLLVSAPMATWAWWGGPSWPRLGREEKLNGTRAPSSCKQKRASLPAPVPRLAAPRMSHQQEQPCSRARAGPAPGHTVAAEFNGGIWVPGDGRGIVVFPHAQGKPSRPLACTPYPGPLELWPRMQSACLPVFLPFIRYSL